MINITELLQQVAPSSGWSPSTEVVDADVERGLRAMAQQRRRRGRIAVASMATIAAAAAVIVVAHPFDGSSPSTPSVATAARGQEARDPSRSLAVKLIAYTGPQVDGFTIDRAPEGWRLSGSTPYALTIVARDATNPNENPDVYEGKLTVLLQSQSASGLPEGEAVTVAGRPGVVTNFDQQMLTYEDAEGHTVVVQVPAELGWSTAQIVDFAAGVHVTGAAIAGLG